VVTTRAGRRGGQHRISNAIVPRSTRPRSYTSKRPAEGSRNSQHWGERARARAARCVVIHSLTSPCPHAGGARVLVSGSEDVQMRR
jgi:hypothetical protein